MFIHNLTYFRGLLGLEQVIAMAHNYAPSLKPLFNKK